jgi:NAD(P)-dependent dehydrogenase (short-subunit alcohol dehydrogenase family)
VGLVARDAVRGEQARTQIAEMTENERVALFMADLSSLASVRSLGGTVARVYPALDLLIHCAGVYTRRRTVTPDGFETMFATNVLGPFLLTDLLLAPLRAAPAARILVLGAPATNRLDFDDLQGERRFSSLTAFGASKAAGLLFSFELARRLEDSGVTANAVHPGLVRTNLMHQALAPMRWATRLVSAPPARAAAAIVPLALAPEYEGMTGRFFKSGREIEPPPYTRDPDVARHLWAVCTSLTKPDEGVPAWIPAR